VLVLLLGEIDLSVGAVSGLAAGVMAVLSVQHGWAPILGIGAGLMVGVLIGFFNGLVVTRFGVPSFVVTLAGLLAWQGALLYVLGDTGSVNLPPSIITDLTTTFFDPAIGWVLGIAAIAGFAATQLFARRRRQAAGLEVSAISGTGLRIGLVAAAVIGAVAILNEDRGVPLAAVIVVVLMILFTFITERTRYGRHIFAVGGNAEAARRAGINVNRIKVSVFTLASMLAAAGGILAASRLLAVNQQSGSGDVLLLAIAGPVIAGTSLFGGRGYVWSALLGAIVIGSISNGMDLLALDSDIKFMITGAVLLLAVTIDAVTRLRREATR
jgi:D-xylose transport system permease protein